MLLIVAPSTGLSLGDQLVSGMIRGPTHGLEAVALSGALLKGPLVPGPEAKCSVSSGQGNRIPELHTKRKGRWPPVPTEYEGNAVDFI
jgi:hypothetical protein